MGAGWLDDLNPAQREAVTHGDGPLLVIAGAGTGKTRTLACRVAHLVERGVPGHRILLLTFTRRAAAEMLSRAGHLTDASRTGRIWGGTFHSVANRLLRIYGRALQLAPDFTVMDQGDAADLMNLVRSDLGIARRDRRFPRKETLVKIYSRAVNSGQNLKHLLEKHYPWCLDDLESIRDIFKRYGQRKHAQNVLDYDDLLLLLNVLCETPGAGDAVSDQFSHVLVDEYQDTNSLQAHILRALRKNNTNIMVVGDDAQSIYSFRAATVRNILDFPEQFPGARIVTLEQNYRSTTPILAASNAVMDTAAERYTKNLWSLRQSQQKPLLMTCFDEADQCKAVCRRILEHRERGIPLMRQAVLFRTGWHSDQLEIELARRNIPFHKYGGLKFIEAAHVKDLLAFLRILENPFDEISWFRILLMFDGIGPRSAQRIMDALGVRRPQPDAGPAHPDPVPSPSTPPDAWHEADPREEVRDRRDTLQGPLRRLLECPPAVPHAGKEQFDAFCSTIRSCLGPNPEAPASSPPVNGRAAGRRSGGPKEAPLAVQVELIHRFYEPIFETRYENSAVRLRDIEQLEQIAAGYGSRRRFLADLTLDPPSATSDLAQPPHLDEDWLTLSTIHSAKGCEWDVVHIIHVADGMIPSDMAVEDAEGVEEERRLLYVAMTRARDTLYLYFPMRYYRKPGRADRHLYAQLTRFITPQVRPLFEQNVELEGDPGTRPEAFGNARQRVEQSLQQQWQ